MGLFSGITRALGGLIGGGGGGTTASSSQSTSNTTNIKIDLDPLAQILSDSQIKSAQISENGSIKSAQIASYGLVQSAKSAKEAQQISFISEERNRALEVQKQNKLDTYLEHAKNGLVLSGVVVALLYVSKKGNKNAK